MIKLCVTSELCLMLQPCCHHKREWYYFIMAVFSIRDFFFILTDQVFNSSVCFFWVKKLSCLLNLLLNILWKQFKELTVSVASFNTFH
jgi:hypothetical protein